MQKIFRKIILLIHYNSTCIIYINVNIFKRRDFNVVIYYLKFKTNFNQFKHEKIEFFFLKSNVNVYRKTLLIHEIENNKIRINYSSR